MNLKVDKVAGIWPGGKYIDIDNPRQWTFLARTCTFPCAAQHYAVIEACWCNLIDKWLVVTTVGAEF